MTREVVAIKMAETNDLHEEDIQDIINEAEWLRKLSNPTTVTFKDLLVEKDKISIVMSIMDMDLLQYLNINYKSLTEKELKFVFRETVEAI